METIRNYLDAMFAQMPSSPAVLRAKDELWQMMEDKYNELIAEGKTENEAVGTVIAEFGNLSELADELGVEAEVKEVAYQQTVEQKEEAPRRIVTTEEAKEYLATKSNFAFQCGLGVGLCIMSIPGCIMADALLPSKLDGLTFLVWCAFIAAGVVNIVLSAVKLNKWKFLQAGGKKNALSMDTTKYVVEEEARYLKTGRTNMTIGILLCALCWIPCVFESMIPLKIAGDIAGTVMFSLVAIGVFLIIQCAQNKEGYKILLAINGKDTMMAAYKSEVAQKPAYINPVVEGIMSVYWPTVICAYLIVCFITGAWIWASIIWPVAILVAVIVNKTCMK